MRPVIGLLMLLLGGAAGSARAEDGRWIRAWDIIQVNAGCTQSYRCVPARPVKLATDERIVSASSRRIWGVCAAGIGPFARCTQCITNPPQQKCTFKVVKK